MADLCFNHLVNACTRRVRQSAGMESRAIPDEDMICAKATKLYFRHVLNNTEALFRHRDTLLDSSWKKTLESGKKVLKMCSEDDRIRYVLNLTFSSSNYD